ncbi:MAG: proteobacterial dedicated sortase system histidine kinase [Gammaproteobacteria bacterium]
MRIRVKLLLLCLVMLSIPYVGFQYLRETERYLQSSLEESLGSVAAAMSIAMQYQSSTFTNSIDELSNHGGLFVHQLGFPIQVDGYADEWQNYVDWSERFKVSRPTSERLSAYQPSLSGFNLIIGEYDNYLYALLLVQDGEINYMKSEDPFEVSDRVELIYENDARQIESMLLSPVGPGQVTAYKLSENWDFSYSKTAVTNVVGAWQETEQGYVVEIRLPSYLIPNLLGFVVHDGVGRADVERSEDPLNSMFVAGTNDRHTRSRPNRLLRTSAQLRQMIDRVGLKPGQRLWVLNRNGQVLATGGSLINERKQGAINFLYTWILPRPSDTFEDELRTASRLQGAEVLAALKGQPDSRWRSSPDERAVIVSAAHPVRAGNELVGAVVIEETTNSIQTLQRDAMASLYNKSILVIVIATGIIMLFASRLSYRILTLKRSAENAIDEHGRIIGQIPVASARDEIGDLSRSFAAMTGRLGEYHEYLESMASKLSHEIRTPISVVSSSLDNLQQIDLPADGVRYVERAREGVARLQNLLARLSEAARLEQSITQVEKTPVELVALIQELVKAYAEVYTDNEISFVCDLDSAHVMGSADLVAQMLDKLVANAADFCGDADSRITVQLVKSENQFELSVTNKGSALPSEMQDSIFNSMISMRPHKNSNRAHLGLGLYIVRLIAEYHQGHAQAANLADKSGVKFSVSLPAYAGA